MVDIRYIEIAIGHPGNRGVVIPLPDLPNYLKEETALFRSYYSFDSNLPDHFKIRKTIKNYKGDYYLDRIVFDIDKGKDSIETCRQKCIDFIDSICSKLEIANEEERNKLLGIWFSGRGYHVVIPDIFGFKPSNDLPKAVKMTLEHYFPVADNIYDGSRLIRVGHTMNEKSRLYKIPISYEEINNLKAQEILDLAKEPRRGFKRSKLDKLEKSLEIIIPDVEVPITKGKDDFNPTAMVSCVQKMYAEGDIKGSRHTKLLRMCSWLMRNGIPKKAAQVMLLDWAKSLEPLEILRIIDDCYKMKYRYGCFDPVMDRYCAEKCVYYPTKLKRQDALVPVLSAQDMERKFIETIRKDTEFISFNLKDLYPDSLVENYWFKPSQLAVVMGDTGMGKTAWVQNLMVDIDLKCLWLSLENPADLTYRRFIQIALGKTDKEVIDHYQTSDNTWSNSIQHISCLVIPPKIEQIRKLVAETEPKVLVVDTIDCIRVSRYIHDSMFKMDEIISELRDIATGQDIIVIGVSHVTKADSRSGSLDVHSGKHSSSIAQKSDKIIVIEGNLSSIARRISSKKSRDEKGFSLDCIFDVNTFRFVANKREE